jgi:hypothetical protein
MGRSILEQVLNIVFKTILIDEVCCSRNCFTFFMEHLFLNTWHTLLYVITLDWTITDHNNRLIAITEHINRMITKTDYINGMITMTEHNFLSYLMK